MAAGIAAGAALVAVILTNLRQTAGAVRLPAGSAREVATALPAPLPPPTLPVGGNLERCIEFCAQHVTNGRSFVVFSKGTCVIVDEPDSQPIVTAIHTLEDCSGPNARFIAREIEDGHHLVTYRRPVFHCLFSEEIESQRPAIESSYLRYLTPAEKKSMPPEFDPPFHAKLGLVARARLNQDAADPVVVKVIRPKPIESPAGPYEPFGPPELGLPHTFPDPGHQPLVVPPFLPGA